MKAAPLLLLCLLPQLRAAEAIVRLSDRAEAAALSPWGRIETTDSMETLVIDTLSGRGVWNPAFRTAESFFAPGKTYEISFRCLIEE